MNNFKYAAECLKTAKARLIKGKIADALWSLEGALNALREVDGWDWEIRGGVTPPPRLR